MKAKTVGLDFNTSALFIRINCWGYIQAEIARQEARLKMERENLEKEKSVLMGTASNQDNQDGALEITVSGEKYRCLRFAKAKKWQTGQPTAFVFLMIIKFSSCSAAYRLFSIEGLQEQGLGKFSKDHLCKYPFAVVF